MTRSLALVLALCATQSTSFAAEWIRYTSKEGGYSVMFPEKPAEQWLTTQAGHKFQRVRVEGEGKEMMIVAIPRPAQDDRSVDELLDAVRDGAVAAAQAKILFENEITFKGVLGRDLCLEGVDAGRRVYSHYRILLTKDHLMQQIIVRSEHVQMDVMFADMFYNSLDFKQETPAQRK